METLDSEPKLNDALKEVSELKFSEGHEESPFFDASNHFDFEIPISVSNSSSVSDLDYNNYDSIAKQPSHLPESQSFLSCAGLRRRHRQSSKELRFKNSSDGLPDFDIRGSNVSPFNFSWNLNNRQKLNEKLNLSSVRMSSASVGKLLIEDTNRNSLNSRVSSTLTDDAVVDNGSVTVNSSSNFLFTLAGFIIKAIAVQTTMLVAFVTFPIWLTYSSYMFLMNPFAIMRRLKRYMLRKISTSLRFCLGRLKWIVYHWIKRNKSTWKLCLQIGWGLMCSAFVGFILVGLFVFAFVISGAIMKFIMEKPMQKMEQLNFDYTKDNPMISVPIQSSPEPFSLEYSKKFTPGNVAQSRGVPIDHKLQATISLTLPESDYNRNLGIFQVRVDFLSSDGKSLASTTQPCMMKFKSQPLRVLMTAFKLAPLITGYSSESQTLHIKFKGYTEQEIPTSCLRVVLQPRAEFARGGGVPEIYTAYLKLESQLPLLKRILWSWKATLFVWTSIVIYIVGLVFLMLCCMPVILPWLQPRDVTLNNNDSR